MTPLRRLTTRPSRVIATAVLTSGMGWTGTAQAQLGAEEGAATETRQLAPVTVRSRQSIEQRFFAAGSLVTLDRQDIEQLGAESVVDVLRQLPGVQVNAGGNGSVEIRMRGMDRSATQVLIDGEKTGGAGQGGALSLDQLPSDVIERIEVLRAPSAEHTGASGGTINIVLRQPTVKSETIARVTQQHVWGQNATQTYFSGTGPLPAAARRADSTTDAKLDRAPDAVPPWTYFVAGGANERITGSDVTRSVQTSSPGIGAGTLLSQSQSQSAEQYRFRTAQVWLIPRVSARLGPLDQLNLRGMFVGTRTGGHIGSGMSSVFPGTDPLGSTFSRTDDDSQTHRSTLQLRADWTRRFKGSKLESVVSAQSNPEKLDRYRSQTLGTVSNISTSSASLGSTVNTTSLYNFSDNQRENLFTLSTKLTGTADPLLWMTGAELERRQLRALTQPFALVGNPVATNTLGARTQRSAVWGQNEWDLGAFLPDNTTLTAGLRLEHLDTRADYNGQSVQTQRAYLQPSVHLRAPLSEQFQLRANLARVSRSPAALDLIDRRVPALGVNSPTNPDMAGNPLLRPESTVTFDTGFERRLGEQGQMGLSLFTRHITDVIARRVSLSVAATDTSAAQWAQRPENVGNATVWGLEADAKSPIAWPSALGLGRDWNLSANASLLQSRLSNGPSAGQRIPGQARYLLNVNLATPQPQKAGWYGGTGLSVQGAADQNTSPTATGREAAYATVDAYVGQVVSSWGYWRLQVYNLTNSRRDRARQDLDTSGRSYMEQTSLRWTPRLFLTVGMRF